MVLLIIPERASFVSNSSPLKLLFVWQTLMKRDECSAKEQKTRRILRMLTTSCLWKDYVLSIVFIARLKMAMVCVVNAYIFRTCLMLKSSQWWNVIIEMLNQTFFLFSHLSSITFIKCTLLWTFIKQMMCKKWYTIPLRVIDRNELLEVVD
jgi:hypothetical protein